jgi:uncharacterized protein YbcI
MADPGDQTSVSEAQLDAVTEALVSLHERYHGRSPGSARTQLMGDDMIACLLGDIYTNVEQTMIEMQRQAMVQKTRSEFQRAMEKRFIDAVERITNRRVARFISTHHVGPDLELELFVLEPAGRP